MEDEEDEEVLSALRGASVKEPGSRPTESVAERRTDRSGSSCESLRSDQSIFLPPYFSPGPAPSLPSVAERRTDRSGSSCESLRSDRSIFLPPYFSPGPAPSLPQTPTPLCCGLCGSVLTGPDSSSCGLCGSVLTGPDSSSCGLCVDQSETQDLGDYRRSLLQRCERAGSEGAEKRRAPFSQIFSELYITEGLSSEDSVHHEETQMEALSKRSVPDVPLSCRDMFKALAPEQQGALRAVLTLGAAGAGKTFSVLKFCVDWAQGSEEQELVVPLSFREMNLVRRGRYSLMELIRAFHPALRLSPGALSRRNVLFICDGLDESRLPLDFSCEAVSELTQSSEVSVLLVNLIRGDLLPQARIWITSRPAAANQIPARCVHRLTEVRGFFTDEQKEMFFRSRFSDEEQLQTVLSHVRSSRSLHTMCQIPVFSSITSTVLEHVLRSPQSQLPQTLTDLYAHFLLVQTQRKRKEASELTSELTSADCQLLLKLGRLAFDHLQRGNLTFYQEDLQQVGLDLEEASVHSGLLTEIFRRESIFNKSVYCFVHLSLQEFLAAVHVLHCFNTKNNKELKKFVKDLRPDSAVDVFLRKALHASLKSPNGHLDLFVRFLHGLTLESNQKLLGPLLGPSQTDPGTQQTLINNLKDMKTKASPDRSINIFHCLTELHDQSVHQQVQKFLKSTEKDRGMKKGLSLIHCSALVHALLTSEQVLEKLELKSYCASNEGRLRLVPAVRNCRQALLVECKLSKVHLEIVASTLKSGSSPLRVLDLSENPEVNSEIQVLCEGLQSPDCRLESLKLNKCGLCESSCAALASALKSSSCRLKVLDLLDNSEVKDSGVERLCDFLKSPNCRLENLNLRYCDLTEVSCSSLAAALRLNPSHLKVLDVRGNRDVGDAGVERLCDFLQNPECRLENLSVYYCNLTTASCSSLASALKSNPSHLRELDIGANPNVKDAGVELLCGYLQRPDCHLEVLRVAHTGLEGPGCSSLAAALRSNPSHLRVLDMWANTPRAENIQELRELEHSPDYRLQDLWCHV